jgi:hypothetical protein
LIVLLFSPTVLLRAGEPARQTLFFNGVPSEVNALAAKPDQLWISTPDLKRVTGFEVKPEGICNDRQCIPIPDGQTERFVTTQANATYFNLAEFAQLLRQPAAHDAKNSVWYFGPRPEQQNSYVGTLDAPNFTLPDMDGKSHSLADFRGKKILLITWASW